MDSSVFEVFADHAGISGLALAFVMVIFWALIKSVAIPHLERKDAFKVVMILIVVSTAIFCLIYFRNTPNYQPPQVAIDMQQVENTRGSAKFIIPKNWSINSPGLAFEAIAYEPEDETISCISSKVFLNMMDETSQPSDLIAATDTVLKVLDSPVNIITRNFDEVTEEYKQIQRTKDDIEHVTVEYPKYRAERVRATAGQGKDTSTHLMKVQFEAGSDSLSYIMCSAPSSQYDRYSEIFSSTIKSWMLFETDVYDSE